VKIAGTATLLANQSYDQGAQDRYKPGSTSGSQGACINWNPNWAQGGSQWACSVNNPKCQDKGWQDKSFNYNWTCYKPNQSSYWFVSTNLQPASAPVVDTLLTGNSPYQTDSNATNPVGAVFSVLYNITMPSNSISPDDITNLLTIFNKNSISTYSQSKNITAAQNLIQDFCNYNGTTAMSSDLCKSACDFQTFFNNNNATQPIKMCCDASKCQQGFLLYCNQPSTFSTTPCQNFYTQSYSSTGTINPNVQGLLQQQCAAATTTGTNPTDVNSPLTSDVQDVCGCYLPQSVYTAFQNKITQNNPGLNSFFTMPQCYYPMCVNNSAMYPNQSASGVCPSNTITTCISETNTTLNAGGSISNVQVTNDQVQSCISSNSAPSGTPAPAATIAVSSGTSIPGTATPIPTVAGGYTPTPTTSTGSTSTSTPTPTIAGAYTPTPIPTAGPYSPSPSPSSSQSKGFCVIL
jgi:hypothetical protein